MKLYLDAEYLHKVAIENKEGYNSADPFLQIVLDNILLKEALDGVLRELSDIEAPSGKKYKPLFEAKQKTRVKDKLSVFIKLILYQFNSLPFLKFLETLTGRESLIPDSYFFGGGLYRNT